MANKELPKNKRELVEKYAYMIVKLGINLQPGQSVIVEAGVEAYEFANIFAEEAYKLGAEEVSVNYLDLALLKTETKYRSLEEVTKLEDWQKERYEFYMRRGCCVVRLETVNPALMEDVSEDKANAVFKFVDNWRNIMRANDKQWCIAMVPTTAWAEYLFPNMSPEDALEKLWETVLGLCYVDEEHDIVEAWKAKEARNHEKALALDALNLVKLHYTSGNGTDLIIGVPPESNYAWETAEDEIYYAANIPSEEMFISPHKYMTEGVVYATKPLVLGGKKIENFGFRFHEGKVVEVLAEEGKEMLESLINTDEGAAYLGEAALVEYHSPISMSGLVYYTTLIDENASCHLALGRCYSSLERDYYNRSQIHVDFMIGAADTCIVGTTADGKEVVIFDKGDFAI